MKLVHLNNRRIVIARIENKHVAFDDRCTHKGGSLAGGSMICGTVQCPWHGSQFDVITGEVKAGPALEHIRIYPLQEEEGQVYLTV
jgi:nitrite reductase/ring-hydroxylating ferredoxin subunit